jgi:NAD(P)-dependent dehydrogenase (short-subunit alcohol dehydrogenase family)
MPAEWRNQVAVVTGGARGIGRATARLLAHHGAAVCVNYAVQSDAAEAVPIVNLIRWRARTNRAMLSPDVGRLQSNLVAADRAVPIEGDT